MNISKKIAVAVCVATLCGSAQAGVILGYGVSSGNITTPTQQASDLTGSTTLGLGAGFTKFAGAPSTVFAIDRTSGFDYATSADLTLSSPTAKTFVDVTVTFATGSSYNLSTFSYGIRRATGETISLTYDLFIKVAPGGTGGSFTDTGLSFSLTSSATTVAEQSFDLTGITALQGVGNGDIVTFRLAVFTATTGDTASTSDFAFQNTTDVGLGASGFTGAIALDGTSLSPVPEPSVFSLAAGLGILGFAAYRRKCC